MIWNEFGQGRAAYLPWAACRQYHDHSRPEHSALLADVLAAIAGAPPLATTDAHPSVEITLHRQEGTGRALVHLVNFSGHQDRAFHPPVTMRDIRVQVRLPGVTRAWAARAGQELAIGQQEGYVSFTVPTLQLFEVVALEIDRQ